MTPATPASTTQQRAGWGQIRPGEFQSTSQHSGAKWACHSHRQVHPGCGRRAGPVPRPRDGAARRVARIAFVWALMAITNSDRGAAGLLPRHAAGPASHRRRRPPGPAGDPRPPWPQARATLCTGSAACRCAVRSTGPAPCQRSPTGTPPAGASPSGRHQNAWSPAWTRTSVQRRSRRCRRTRPPSVEVGSAPTVIAMATSHIGVSPAQVPPAVL